MKLTHTKHSNKHSNKHQKHLNKHFDKLNHKSELECLENQNTYQHPEHPKLKAIFPFITSYEEVNRIIYSNVLSDHTGIPVKQMINQVKNIKSIEKDLSSHDHKHKVNLSKDIQKELNFKLNSPVYELVSSRTVFNTLNYLFQKISSGIYVQIKDNAITSFIPFINTNFINNWSHLIKLPEKYKNLDEYYQAKKTEFSTEGFKYLNNKDLWRASNCLIQTGPLASINDSHWAEMYKMLELTCQNYQIDDVEFFINTRHTPLLKNDFTEPFDKIYGKNTHLTSYIYPSYHPILSISTNDDYGDLSYPSPDDWKLITKEFYKNDCVNIHANNIINHEFGWDNKKEILYFRDDDSGCGTTSKNNVRIRLISLAKKYPDLIDAKITKVSERDIYDKELQFHHTNILDVNIESSDITYEKYKYIISTPSYGVDTNFSYYLSIGCLIFKVEGEYSAWYDHLLKPYKHYIPVKKDLSDLVVLIKWAKTHDDTAHKIAKNGQHAFKKYFNKDTILEYWNYLLNSIAHKRLNTDSLDDEFNIYKTNITVIPHIPFAKPITQGISHYKLGVIIPYYNENIEYKRIRDELVSHLIKMFSNYTELQYKIIVVEQFNDKSKFNKGQLVNLGLLIAKKHKCTHIVINNLRFKPTKPLIPYYLSFEQADKAPVHIGFNWLAKYKGHYLGKCSLWNLKMLENIGGYNSNIWGWGSSDAILYHRYLKYANKNKFNPVVYIPTFEEAGTLTYVNQVEPIQQHLLDGQYSQLKILLDWYQAEYTDIHKLEKFMKNILKKTIKNTITHTSNTKTSNTNNNRYRKNLELMYKHLSDKNDHYIFTLLNDHNTSTMTPIL